MRMAISIAVAHDIIGKIVDEIINGASAETIYEHKRRAREILVSAMRNEVQRFITSLVIKLYDEEKGLETFQLDMAKLSMCKTTSNVSPEERAIFMQYLVDVFTHHFAGNFDEFVGACEKELSR